MIKAVIFDVGGVIIDIKPLLMKTLDVFQPSNADEFWKEVNDEAVPLCRGKMTLLEFWRRIAQKCHKDIPDDVLKELWIKDYNPLLFLNQDVHEIIATLKGRYKLAIVSNTMREHGRIDSLSGIFDLFDVVLLSHEVGLTKDEEAIFFLVAEKLGVKPEECIFVDDFQKFVDIAASVGMKAILFEDANQLKRALNSFDVPVI